MGYELEKFSAGTMDKGVQLRSMDFQQTLVLAADASNMTQGLEQGLGPRYGMAPIPGQMSTELAASTRLPNMMQAESATLPVAGYGFYGRTKIYGVVPVNVPDPTDITKRIVSYAFIMSTTADSSASLDIALTSTWGGSYENASADIRDGFGTPCNATSAIYNPSVMNIGIVPISTSRTTAQRAYLNLATTSQYWARFASVNVSAGNIPMQWFVGDATATGDAVMVSVMGGSADSCKGELLTRPPVGAGAHRISTRRPRHPAHRPRAVPETRHRVVRRVRRHAAGRMQAPAQSQSLRRRHSD